MNTFISPDLFFFILVAAFLIIRLRSVLGRRTGNEKKPKDIFMYQDTNIVTDKKKASREKQTIESKPLIKVPINKENNFKTYSDLKKINY